jgi:hypothetical protein
MPVEMGDFNCCLNCRSSNLRFIIASLILHILAMIGLAWSDCGRRQIEQGFVGWYFISQSFDSGLRIHYRSY